MPARTPSGRTTCETASEPYEARRRVWAKPSSRRAAKSSATIVIQSTERSIALFPATRLDGSNFWRSDMMETISPNLTKSLLVGRCMKTGSLSPGGRSWSEGLKLRHPHPCSFDSAQDRLSPVEGEDVSSITFGEICAHVAISSVLGCDSLSSPRPKEWIRASSRHKAARSCPTGSLSSRCLASPSP